MKKELSQLKMALDQHGILLLTDTKLPSLTTLIAGEPVKGSWWGHPRGNLMYNLSNELMDAPDILTLKLINKKITFVDKRHWDALYRIATAGEPWQFKRLDTSAKAVLDVIAKAGQKRADDPSWKKPAAVIGKSVKTLETRLLLYSESVHTDAGKHVRQMQTWKHLMKSKKHTPSKLTYIEARTHFEMLKSALNHDVKFPWSYTSLPSINFSSCFDLGLN